MTTEQEPSILDIVDQCTARLFKKDGTMKKPREESNAKWDTWDEIAWVKRLGTGYNGRVSDIPRLELLKRYRDAAAVRSAWGNIDPKVVFKAVGKMIKEEEWRKQP